MIATKSVYKNNQTETLADVRQYVARYPETISLRLGELARRLGRAAAVVEAALEWLVRNELEVRA